MLCCLKNSREKKNLSKPLLAESKTYGGEPKIGEPKTGEPKIEAPKIIERKLTGFEPAPLPAPKPFVILTPKTEPIVVKSEPEPESLPEPEPESLQEPEPEPIKQEPKISEPVTSQEEFPAPKEKKNRSKSNRR